MNPNHTSLVHLRSLFLRNTTVDDFFADQIKNCHIFNMKFKRKEEKAQLK